MLVGEEKLHAARQLHLDACEARAVGNQQNRRRTTSRIGVQRSLPERRPCALVRGAASSLPWLQRRQQGRLLHIAAAAADFLILQKPERKASDLVSLLAGDAAHSEEVFAGDKVRLLVLVRSRICSSSPQS